MFRLRRRRDSDFEDEIRAHIELEADHLVEQGMTRGEAINAARRAFGNVTTSRERYYESRRFMPLEHLLRDVRHALRGMRKSPGSTAVIVLSLSLGIGAMTSVFSLADQALVRALPVSDPSAIVQLHWNGRFIGGSFGFGSLLPHPFFRDLRAEQEVFEDVFARSQTDALFAAGDETESVSTEVVSGSFFTTLGLRPVLGRLIHEDDDRVVDAHPVVVLSYDFWRRRFGGDPQIVGASVRLNEHPMTVVGVAEQGFRGMDWSLATDVWIPMMMSGHVVPGRRLSARRQRFVHVYGRLRPGMERQRAEVALQPWFRNYIRADTEREGWPGVTAQHMKEYLASTLELIPGARGQAELDQPTRGPMVILLGATALGLLLACLNVANLTLARTLAARRVIALRSALGASRSRIVGSQLVDSALLASLGGFVGALSAPVVSAAILAFLPSEQGARVSLQSELDARVLGFAFGVTLLVTLIAGAAPAFYATRVEPLSALKRQGATLAGGLAWRRILVVVQFALALILLVGAGLFARTLGTLKAEGLGFPTTNLVMFRLTPTQIGFDRDRSIRTLRSLYDELEAAKALEGVALAGFEMFRAGAWSNSVQIQSDRRFATEEFLPMNAVSPGFFATLGARIVQGRDFDSLGTAVESEGGRKTAVVNEEFVARYLPGTDPIGVRIGIGSATDVVMDHEIVGVVSNFRVRSLRVSEAQVFFSLWERPFDEGTFYVRSRSSSITAADAIREAVGRVDPRLTMLSLRTIEDQFDRMVTFERILATTAIAFAAAATVLAMIGLYGLLSFSASLREKEMGVRLALGAQRSSAFRLIVHEALRLVAVGTVLALPLVWLLGRVVESWLFGVQPLDVITLANATCVIAGVCLLASAVPARRSARASVVAVLRAE